MKQKTKWTADEICEMVAWVILLVAIAVFWTHAFRVAWKEKEAKASGQSECAAKHIPAEAPLR
jgi:hypothetical protein